MFVHDLVNYCDYNYKNEDCMACTSFTSCDHECNLNCKECLDDIHFHHNKRRDEYNCERLLDYYVCRYSFKYCSEIIYALREMDLSNYPFFHILSLGCGGVPDLMAFQYMNYPQNISYVGFDKNVYWEKIHNYIVDNFNDGRVQLVRNIDVLQYFDDNELFDCNVIVIQYLISFFYSHVGKNGIRRWFSKLTDNIVKKKPQNLPMLIIINDVDSINTGRDAFPLFIEEIRRVGLTVSAEMRRRFKEAAYFAGSKCYSSNRNIFNGDISSDFAETYCVARTCESAQLILEVY